MNRFRRSDGNTVTHVEVEGDQAGQRIDNFLARYLKGVPRSHIYRILRSGEVRVNKGRVKPGYRLTAEDQIRIPPLRSRKPTPSMVPDALRARLEAAVLLEDDDLIVLDKPAGLAVHGGSGLDYGVIEILRQSRPHAPTLELVHRLDRDTSGCLLIAKSRRMLNALHSLLREGYIDKHYIALVAGAWQGHMRKVAIPVARRPPFRTVVVREGGKQAQSVFRPLTRFEQCTLVEVRIGTGRMHQIRVHAAHVGHPIAGDEKYGDRAFNHLMRERGLRRLFLHAVRLNFRILETSRRYAVEAPLDSHLQQVLENLSGKRLRAVRA
jgi:23S rRNA pseudouridine955/2504/2580 synthase